ncbi:MAG TPA: hypothetical protein VIP98_16510 [Microlunatus sp.]
MKKAMLSAALSAATLAAAGGMLATTAPGAAAAASHDIGPVHYYSASGESRGVGMFAADPEGPYPGDAIAACDTLADGWGIEVQLDVNPGSSWHTDRLASTGGHPSGYCTKWLSKNIKEETRVAIRVCKVKAHHHTACGKQHYGWA